LGAGGSTVLELRIDREAVTPTASISQIRVAARAAAEDKSINQWVCDALGNSVSDRSRL